MISQAKVQEAELLLAEGKLSQRKIARLVGSSRASVASIADGSRPDYEALRRERGADLEPLGPVERCPECGGKVYMPCRLCRIRRLKAEERAARNRKIEQVALRIGRPSPRRSPLASPRLPTKQAG